ncbi:hypothetical protein DIENCEPHELON_62 [Klebsiella phage vB_KaeS_Diencephalon]|nr:hypothetical protein DIENCEPHELON_62 [Klebsiella phage vB_KaeS_Diencephalon]
MDFPNREDTNMTEPVNHVVERNKAGRPSMYTEDMPEALLSHFRVDLDEVLPHNFTTAGKSNIRVIPKYLPSMVKFCESVGITTTTLHRWRAEHKEFSDAYTQARQLYEDLLIGVGLATNSTFATFLLKASFGYRDNTEIVVKGDDTKPIRLKIVSERPEQPGGDAPKDEAEAVDWGDD